MIVALIVVAWLAFALLGIAVFRMGGLADEAGARQERDYELEHGAQLLLVHRERHGGAAT